MMKRLLTGLMLWVMIVGNASADTYYVWTNSPSDGPGTNWATAFHTIQGGVDASAEGDNVLVTNGLYNSGSRMTLMHSSYNRVLITSDITVRSVNGPEETIIEGAGPLGSSAVRCVFMTDGALSGFTITNGHTFTTGSSYEDQSGGGIYAKKAVIEDCVIVGNSAEYGGGGIFGGSWDDQASEVRDCVISGNYAGYGGGASYYGRLIGCDLLGNNSALYGGGASSATLINCRVIGNSAKMGGGLDHPSSNVNLGDVFNCLIAGNAAEEGGGSHRSRLFNCTVTLNTAKVGAGVYRAAVTNSIVYHNIGPGNPNHSESTFTHSCTIPFPGGTGNTTNSPGLVDISHIRPGSPCVGMGLSSLIVGADLDGDAWAIAPAIGCDEPDSAGRGALSVAVTSEYALVSVGHEVELISDIRGRAASNRWTFGDGLTAENELGMNHVWSSTGVFDVVVTAYNPDHPSGLSATTSVSVVGPLVHYADQSSSSPTWPYDTWATAATTIQGAVDAATVPGALVLVSNGVYATARVLTPGYALLNRVVITNDIVVRSVNGPEVTVIKGTGPMGPNAVRGVYIEDGRLEGFTITSGSTFTNGAWSEERSGGGVFAGDGVVSDCVIVGNSAHHCGGGTYGGTFTACIIKGNRGLTGGGTYRSDLSSCYVTENDASRSGGGISYGQIKHCTITHNSAERGGGVQYGKLDSSIVYYNYATRGDHNFYDTDSIKLQWFVDSCTTPYPMGIGTITNAPGLVGGAHILQSSPCVGAGSDREGTDIDGDPWAVPPAIGCDEPVQSSTGRVEVSIGMENPIAIAGIPHLLRADITGPAIGNHWDFDDGTSADDVYVVEHVWSNAGTYSVRLSAFGSSSPAVATTTVSVIDQPIHYVRRSGSTPVWPYTSWATAASVIQHAVNVATVPGSLVLVDDGKYSSGYTQTPGFSTMNRVVITNDITLRSVNGPEVTTIFANYAMRGLFMSAGRLEGFTVEEGYCARSGGDAVYDRSGAGVCASASVVVRDCIISNNIAVYGGGTSRGTFIDCEIKDNEAIRAGGSSFSHLINCTVSGNEATYYEGGGTYYGEVEDCRISGNSTARQGGGVSRSLVKNSIITGNYAERWGGGVYRSTVYGSVISGNTSADIGGGAGVAELYNCNVTSNTAETGGGIYQSTAYNSIIYYNNAAKGPNHLTSDFFSSCTEPAPGGQGNKTDPPMLTSSSHIHPSSPCAGAGSSMYVSGADIDGDPWASPPSMGCDEPGTSVDGLLTVMVTAEPVVSSGYAIEIRAQINGAAASNRWAFGDGLIAENALVVEHAWATAGTYDVVVTAYNAAHPGGLSGTARVSVVAQQIYYVDGNSPTPTLPYASWNNAAHTIQEAVDAASVPGSLVLVADGTYEEGTRETPGYLALNRVVITKDIVVRSDNGPGGAIIRGRGTLGAPGTVRGVFITAGRLSGFTISGGRTLTTDDYTYDRCGGGIWAGDVLIDNCVIENSEASLGGGVNGGTYSNCIFTGNMALSGGGGAYGAVLHDSFVSSNSVESSGGGGISWCVASDSRIISNSASYGGGINWSTVKRCVIVGNRADEEGGGSTDSDLDNCLIYGNHAGTDGGGASGGSMISCTVVSNSADGRAGGVDAAEVINSIVYYNSAPIGRDFFSGTFSYSCTAQDPGTAIWPGVYPPPTIADAGGNITNEPAFMDVSAEDYRLLPHSACIDAGADLEVGHANDIIMNIRPVDGDGDGIARADIGAYEFSPLFFVTRPNEDSLVMPGCQFDVSWAGAQAMGTVDIHLLQNGSIVTQLAADVASSGASVTVQAVMPMDAEDLADYCIRVSTTNWGGGYVDSAEFRLYYLWPDDVTLANRYPQFKWRETDGVDWYQLWVMRDGQDYTSGWAAVTNTWTPVAPFSSGDFSWWVRGYNASGDVGPWSRKATFSVPAIGKLTPIRPTGIEISSSLDYLWTADPMASWYQLRIKENGTDWSNVDHVASGTTGTVTTSVSGHRAGADYRWWVRGCYVPGEHGPWSEMAMLGIGGDLDNDGIPDWWEHRHMGDTDANAVADTDGDGLDNLGEYRGDTDPTNAASMLCLRGVEPQGIDVRINWQGGLTATQVIECTTSLTGTPTWTPIYTNLPPTTTNTVLDAGATNGTLFYRIRIP